MFFCDSREDPDTEAELVRTMAAEADGVVLCASLLSDDTIVQLAAVTPLVLINRIVPGVSSVLMDSASGMDQVVAHLESLGHQDYAYLVAPPRRGRTTAGFRAQDAFLATNEQLVRWLTRAEGVASG